MIEISLNIAVLLIIIFAVIGVIESFRFLYKYLTMRYIIKEIKKDPELIKQYNELIKAKEQFLEFLKSINGEEV